ncbi:MAG TPA: TetR/AcrR family transcriptional regulator [Bacillales bacterium]|nr:TetR/AcrR family transcriptional regulator [Bacillales bacterium]
MGKRQKQQEEKRARIVKEAIPLFARSGYTQTTMNEIAKASGVSFGSVFTYFGSKSALFEACVLERLDEWGPLLLEVGGNGGSALRQIEEMIRVHVEWFTREQEYLRLIQYVLGQPDRFESLIRHLDEFLVRFQVALRPLIVQGQANGELEQADADIVALAYISYLNGIRLTIGFPAEEEIWQKFAEQAIWLFRPVRPSGKAVEQ